MNLGLDLKKAAKRVVQMAAEHKGPIVLHYYMKLYWGDPGPARRGHAGGAAVCGGGAARRPAVPGRAPDRHVGDGPSALGPESGRRQRRR